jgi:ABC-2 type transport system ATP-binding protein
MLRLVEEICTRVVIIHRGKIVLDGTLEEIRRGVPELGAAADLEDVFLRATEEAPPA